jgi:5'-methylthioadenosine phosphorylase
VSTFFDEGIAAHVAMADPVCPLLAAATAAAGEKAGAKVHRGGTYVCIEGPQFSTRAESHLYRSWGVSVIGMTNMPEAKLAREAELPYATIAVATDYDCWHQTNEDVNVDAILAVLQRSLETTKLLLVALAPALPDPQKSPAHGALATAVLTDRSQMSPVKRAELAWLLS